MEAKEAFFAATLCVGTLFFSCGLTFAIVSDKLKNEAVSKGVAEYYLDKDHQRQWRWIADRPKE